MSSSSDSGSGSSSDSDTSSESDRPRQSQYTSRQQVATRGRKYDSSDSDDDSTDDGSGDDTGSSDDNRAKYNEILDAPTTRVNMPSGAQATISKPVDYPCDCHRIGDGLKLITIQPGWKGGNEFEIVEAEMHKTLAFHNISHYNITSIMKVQNCCLWARFRNRERQIAKEIKYVNEVMLFHGTAASDSIVRTGFNVAAANPAGMFGPGIYFAENSSKSDRYAAAYLGHKKMLLCRVALGRMLDRRSVDRMTKPPKGYHSVQGVPSPGGLLYKEYVMYHNHQAYPEYVISYTIG